MRRGTQIHEGSPFRNQNTAPTQVNILGNVAAGVDCTCTQVTVPYNSTNGPTLIGAKPGSSGTSSSPTAKPTSGAGTSNGNSTLNGSMSMTFMTSSTCGLLLNLPRRRDIFPRAVGDTVTVKLTPSSGTAELSFTWQTAMPSASRLPAPRTRPRTPGPPPSRQGSLP
ncbi:hypothetical protein HDU88_002302 [Geranomyces variabilis]|nr:hypothetical protein HDU88_002302 [Geranomyces variabilis]